MFVSYYNTCSCVATTSHARDTQTRRHTVRCMVHVRGGARTGHGAPRPRAADVDQRVAWKIRLLRVRAPASTELN